MVPVPASTSLEQWHAREIAARHTWLMLSVIECTATESKHLASLWREDDPPTAIIWTLSRPIVDWIRPTGKRAVTVALVLEADQAGNRVVSRVACASVTRTRNDDLNCQVQVWSAHRLTRPVGWDGLVGGLAQRFHAYLTRDGRLPEGTSEALLRRLRELAPADVPAIDRIASLGKPFEIRTAAHQRKVFERDGTITALKMTGFEAAAFVATRIPEDPASDAPWAHPRARVIEDQMLMWDREQFLDWIALAEVTVGVSRFASPDGRQRLEVYYANRTKAETATGADLIYYHESRRAFVLVQYKAMDRHGVGESWRYDAGGDTSLKKELARLAGIDRSCAEAEQPEDDYRLAMQPTWLKFVQRQSKVPANAELVPGMYVPRPYLAGLLDGGKLKGPRGGTVVGYETVPRYLDNTQFTELVAGGWIGTTGAGTQIVHDVIRRALDGGRDVVYARGDGAVPPRAEQVRDQRNAPRRLQVP